MDSTQKRRITRNRELLACFDCRRRKLKCDRSTPCGSCVKRGDQTSCRYHRFARGSEHERERRLQAESRLEHLEELVQQLAQQGDGPAPQVQCIPHAGGREVTEDEPRSDNGALMPNDSLYHGSTHWSAMLEDIEELKYFLVPREVEAPDEDKNVSQSGQAAKFVLGPATPLPLQQVLAQYLPPKEESDRLIAAYFRSAGIAAPFIHSSSFQNQYKKFWESPQRAPALWISILFSIFRVAHSTLTLFKGTSGLQERYNVASASCLALGEYFRPQKFSVESLLLFVQAQILTGPSMSPDVGLIFGLLIRLATSMGYHKDPENFELSPFEKEMRRRVWSLCMQLDLMISFQLGLPSSIQFPTWDTLPPRNLRDSDFDEETQELPPARPDSESTNILFYIAKHRLMTVFEKILRHTLTTGVGTTSHVDELDDEIRMVYSNLPVNLHPKLIADSIIDSPTTIVTRLCVFNLYQKCLCVLHRPYVTRGRLNSIRACYDAALNIVQYFIDSYRQFLPGGQMEGERWFLGSLTWHDFLLGVTALCLALCAGSQHVSETRISWEKSLRVLGQARGVCGEQTVKSKDGTKVSKLVDATLLRFGNFESGINGDPTSISGGHTGSLFPPASPSSLLGHEPIYNFGRRNDAIQYQAPAQMEAILARDEPTMNSIDYESWEYFEQFLDLPRNDLTMTR